MSAYWAGWLAAFWGLAAGIGAALLLRRSWRKKRRQPLLLAAGWGLIALGLVAPGFFAGEVRGPFIALAAVSTGALIVVFSGIEIRERKARRRRASAAFESLAPEPMERANNAIRRTLRWLLAGPIGMVAAFGVAILYAVFVPGEVQTRLMIAGLLMPLFWGAAMAWTLADNRIWRATAVLAGTAIVTFSLAYFLGLR